jgi:hypothetical protein
VKRARNHRLAWAPARRGERSSRDSARRTAVSPLVPGLEQHPGRRPWQRAAVQQKALHPGTFQLQTFGRTAFGQMAFRSSALPGPSCRGRMPQRGIRPRPVFERERPCLQVLVRPPPA